MADEFKFDLQRFADGGAEGGADDTTGGTEADKGEKGTPNAPETKTKEEQEADVQKRIDDAVSQAKARWEKEYQKKADKAKKEAERLSKLSETERAKEEQEAIKKELEAKEKELNRKELKLEMVKVLSDRKIPVEFMDYLIADDNESTMDRIKTFDKQFKKAVEAAVNEKLKGKALFQKACDVMDVAKKAYGDYNHWRRVVKSNNLKSLVINNAGKIRKWVIKN